MNAGEKLTYGVVGFALILGVIGLIAVWYLALFAIAVIIFLVIILIARKQHKETRDVLQFRPGKLVPAEVWERAEALSPATGSDVLRVTLVELDKYAENWEKFRSIAQIDRPGSIEVFAHLIAYKTPTADKGVILAYDRLILGEVRQIELEHYFDPLWSAGGITMVACTFTFGSSVGVSDATAHFPMFVGSSGDVLPAREQHAWNIIWRAVRGKSPE